MAFRDPLALLARLLLAWIFIAEGLAKIRDYAGTAEYMQSYGVSGDLLPLVILTEFGGGLLVASGLWTRWAALALAGFCCLTALFFHTDYADPDQFIQFQKNVAIAGGFLMLVAFGPGHWSLDGLWARREAAGAAAREPDMV